MTSPRRRVLRAPITETEATRRQHQLHVWQARLEQERSVFGRWLSRLKRAFHAVEKQQRRIARLERQIAQAE